MSNIAMTTKTEKEAQCAKLMGWEPALWGRNPPRYTTNNQLAGEVLDEFTNLKKEKVITHFELFTTSSNDEVGFCYWNESGRHDFFAPTWQEAIVDARIEIGEV